MNAPANITKPESWVKPCHECDGKGEVWNGRGKGGNDPDSWMVECEDCEGKGYFPCEACGFDQHIDGYDCFACDTIDALPSGYLTPANAEILHRALGEALHRSAESYCPQVSV